MKKTLKITEQLTNTDIYICFGNKSYLKLGKKLNVKDLPTLNCNGLCNELTYIEDSSLNCYLIGINDNSKNIYEIKSTIVHELNHVVTYIIKRYGFKGDEFRSYLLAFLYEKSMVWIDKIIDNKK